MKIMTLNTWGGRAGKENLLAFIEKHSKDTDIFCFQEIWSAPHDYLEGTKVGGISLDSSKILTQGKQKISSLLNDYTAYFSPLYTEHYGLLMMVNNKFKIKRQGEVFVYREKGYFSAEDVGDHARCLQYAELENDNESLLVVNFHGLWVNVKGNSKSDTNYRLLQSDKIISFLKEFKLPIVLCGDFNLDLNTESVKKLEDFGLRNLVREFGVTSTRTSHYKKPTRFADYIFVSKGLKIKDFMVLPDEVSDHSPLVVEFD